MKKKYKKLPEYRFRADNAGITMGEVQPWKYVHNDKKIYFNLEKGWKIIGWCENEKLGVMSRKDEGQIAVLFETPNFEECWFHASKHFINMVEE